MGSGLEENQNICSLASSREVWFKINQGQSLNLRGLIMGAGGIKHEKE